MQYFIVIHKFLRDFYKYKNKYFVSTKLIHTTNIVILSLFNILRNFAIICRALYEPRLRQIKGTITIYKTNKKTFIKLKSIHFFLGKSKAIAVG